ncbi:hypothetical protein LGH83_05460 [Lichenihabitans sp. PAMC28606]|uniref:hypothetical protein n=1 Tax=Lichenihabitans sp. PAMC28606 TaxID=2880932 RepID=UPI001D0B91ED|nr:hypothetical protein [Lichenihabitans sp. PAMC28606]UDL95661.1 hypothetical protein LGH83_05460 [Lichenihabitans sp. PAMC28606]
MSTHRYSVGDSVVLDFQGEQLFAKLNPFTIEAQLPPVGSFLQYRIKSAVENFRRVAPEDKLSPVSNEPDAVLVEASPPYSGEED